MSAIKIPVSVELGNSLKNLKDIESRLLGLLGVYDKQATGLKDVKTSIEDFASVGPVVSGQLQKGFEQVAQAGSQLALPFVEAGQAIDPLNAKVEQFKTLLLDFGKGTVDIEKLRDGFIQLQAEAGGIDEALSQLGNIEGIDEFTAGLEDGLKLIEQYGDKAIDLKFDPNKSFDQALREARLNLKNIIAEFGALSPEAQKAAGEVKKLTEQVKDAKLLTEGADFQGKFQLFGRALQGVSAGFQTVLSVQALFGTQSKQTEEALKKVQAAMALTQGIAGILEGVTAFKTLASSIANANILTKIYNVGQIAAAAVTRLFGVAVNTTSIAFKGLAVAIASTGIGALVLALGYVIGKMMEVSSATKELSDELKGFKEGFKSASQSVSELSNKINLAKSGILDQDDVLKEYNDTLGKSIGQVDSLDAAQANIIKNAQNYMKATALKAAAEAFYAKAAEASANKTTAGLEENISGFDKFVGALLTNFGVYNAAQLYATNAQKKGTQERIKQQQKEVDKNNAIADSLVAQAGELQKAYDVKEPVSELEKLNAKLKQLEDKKLKVNTRLETDAINKDIEIVKKEISKITGEETKVTVKKVELSEPQKIKNELESKLKDIDIGIQLGEITDGGLEEKLKAFQEAAAKYLKLGFKIDSPEVKNVLDKINELKIALGAIELQKSVKVEIDEGKGLSKLERFKLQLNELKDKQLKVNTALEYQDLQNQIDVVQGEIDNITKGTPLIIPAKVNVQFDPTGKIDLTPAEKKVQEFSKVLGQTLDSGIESSLSDLGSVLGETLAAGGNVFEAVGNSILSSLGSLLQEIGKQIIAANIIINEAKLKFGLPVLGVLAGVAVVALGAALKASISKKAQKGFASGGYVEGPGTGTSDSIPARLSKGEFVIKEKAVKKYGVDTLNELNEGKIERFKTNRVEQFFSSTEDINRKRFTNLIEKNNVLKLAEGGYVKEKEMAVGGRVTGPGTSTSDSIPARLSNGEYVVNAKSVQKYGTTFFEKLNAGILLPEALQAKDPSRAIVNRSEKPFVDKYKALVNRTENINELTFAKGGLVYVKDDPFINKSRAIVNRSETNIEKFAKGGLVYYSDTSKAKDDLVQKSRAIVNRTDTALNFANGGMVSRISNAQTPLVDRSRAIVNRIDIPTIQNVGMAETYERQVPYIASTQVSGQDLRIILERADKRFSNVT